MNERPPALLVCPACRTRLRFAAADSDVAQPCPECGQSIIISSDRKRVELAASCIANSTSTRRVAFARCEFASFKNLMRRNQPVKPIEETHDRPRSGKRSSNANEQTNAIRRLAFVGCAALLMACVATILPEPNSEAPCEQSQIANIPAIAPINEFAKLPADTSELQPDLRDAAVPSHDLQVGGELAPDPQPTTVVAQASSLLPNDQDPSPVLPTDKLANSSLLKDGEVVPAQAERPATFIVAPTPQTRKDVLQSALKQRYEKFQTSATTSFRQLVRELNELAVGCVRVSPDISPAILSKPVQLTLRDASLLDVLKSVADAVSLQLIVSDESIEFAPAASTPSQ